MGIDSITKISLLKSGKVTDAVYLVVFSNGERVTYTKKTLSQPDNADEIVEKWVKEHPKKTYRKDFLKKFPNAPTDSSGCPNACLQDIYKGADYKCKDNRYLCIDCWNQTIKEVADERKHS